VTLNCRDHYLGHYPVQIKKPPAEVQSAYDSLIALWLASGRRLATTVPPEPVPVAGRSMPGRDAWITGYAARCRRGVIWRSPGWWWYSRRTTRLVVTQETAP
jgi:hypothetical protein